MSERRGRLYGDTPSEPAKRDLGLAGCKACHSTCMHPVTAHTLAVTNEHNANRENGNHYLIIAIFGLSSAQIGYDISRVHRQLDLDASAFFQMLCLLSLHFCLS